MRSQEVRPLLVEVGKMVFQPPRRTASTVRSIPSPLPRRRAQRASPPGRATGQDSSRSSAARSDSRRRLRRRPRPRPTSFLCTSMPAMWYGMGLSLGAERAPHRIGQGRELSRRVRRLTRRSMAHSITHAPDHSCTASTGPLVGSISPPPSHCGSRRFSSSFTGRRPTSTVAEIIPASQPHLFRKGTLVPTWYERRFLTKPTSLR